MATKNPCFKCGEDTEYSFACSHSNVCLPCGKKICEEKEECSRCHTLVTRLQKETLVRFAHPEERSYFVCSFPGEVVVPDLKNSSWKLSKDEEGNRILKKANTNLVFKGRKTSLPSSYMVLFPQDDGSRLAVPIQEWYEFTRFIPPQTDLISKHLERSEATEVKLQKLIKKTGLKGTSSKNKEDSPEKGEPWDCDETPSDDEEITGGEEEQQIHETEAFEEADNEAFLSNVDRDFNSLVAVVTKTDADPGHA